MGLAGPLSHWLPESDGAALRDITLGALLAEQAGRFPERPALLFDGPLGTVRYGYRDLDAAVDRLAKALIAIGVGHRDRVAVMAANSPEWVLLEYALARIGAVLVTVNPALRRAELDYLLAQSGAAMLFAAGEHRGFPIADMLCEMMPDFSGRNGGARAGDGAYPALRRVVSIGGPQIPGALAFTALLARAEEISDEVLATRAAAVAPADIVQIQYTSGTTGKPKGAMLTHRGIVNNALFAGRRAGYRESDVMVSAMPFFHTAGCVCNVVGMAAVGGSLVAMESFDAGPMLDLLERHRGTIVNAVPTMYVRLLQDEALRKGRRDLSAWRIAYVGGTSIPPSLMLELKETVGCDPAIIMGMTECSPIITQTVPDEPLKEKVATAGVPLPHVEIRIVDPATGEIVPIGREGELQIRGFLVTAGYFDMPEATAAAIDADGFLKSGDIAVMDEGGHLRIVGRIKDMLIRGGENVYPVEIEDRLLAHPDVAEAQVVGVPDAEFGEEIFAFVVPRDGRTVEPEALRNWCRQHMARHKMPRHVAVIEATPKTANGKVRKVELRELAKTMIAEGRA
ncbi:AMP-binding protein [Jiella sonneratiae]|uniref:AMP-binding protein n=1 Tax=Jiella sonneratiae TaxID=2816856 RepID=A0ABS3J143_9HYPH|nr:AMP-binding protein [Jiella sonneratiae]MBO0902812.1 AMP-binding protein [Jiella sonneratiae]